MTDSTRRTMRTAFQTLIALCTVVPAILAGLNEVFPADSAGAAQVAAIGGSVLVGVAAVTKVVNVLEESGFIPAWLKGDAPIGAHEAVPPAPPADPAAVPPTMAG